MPLPTRGSISPGRAERNGAGRLRRLRAGRLVRGQLGGRAPADRGLARREAAVGRLDQRPRRHHHRGVATAAGAGFLAASPSADTILSLLCFKNSRSPSLTFRSASRSWLRRDRLAAGPRRQGAVLPAEVRLRHALLDQPGHPVLRPHRGRLAAEAQLLRDAARPLLRLLHPAAFALQLRTEVHPTSAGSATATIPIPLMCPPLSRAAGARSQNAFTARRSSWAAGQGRGRAADRSRGRAPGRLPGTCSTSRARWRPSRRSGPPAARS